MKLNRENINNLKRSGSSISEILEVIRKASDQETKELKESMGEEYEYLNTLALLYQVYQDDNLSLDEFLNINSIVCDNPDNKAEIVDTLKNVLQTQGKIQEAIHQVIAHIGPKAETLIPEIKKLGLKETRFINPYSDLLIEIDKDPKSRFEYTVQKIEQIENSFKNDPPSAQFFTGCLREKDTKILLLQEELYQIDPKEMAKASLTKFAVLMNSISRKQCTGGRLDDYFKANLLNTEILETILKSEDEEIQCEVKNTIEKLKNKTNIQKMILCMTPIYITSPLVQCFRKVMQIMGIEDTDRDKLVHYRSNDAYFNIIIFGVLKKIYQNSKNNQAQNTEKNLTPDKSEVDTQN